jgi:hypothetical protein
MDKHVFLYFVFKEDKTDQEKKEFWFNLACDAGIGLKEYITIENGEPQNIAITSIPISNEEIAFFAGRMSILSYFYEEIYVAGFCFRDSNNLEYYTKIIEELKAKIINIKIINIKDGGV